MARYVCIHGHFYQPPRENPWTAAVEAQPGAHPYHDWNARLAAECYAPNAASRILDGDGRITRIVNNYARISFDFGPTLLSWLAAEEPAIYQAVLAADRDSRERFSGHGLAMAQAYNHVILPLANHRDKQTQVLWGLCDFERRFGRPAAGMWLPETAVDLESLDLMAAHGVRFTVLEPHQARRVRPLAGGGTDVAVPQPLAPDRGGGAAGQAAAAESERAGGLAARRAEERSGSGWREVDGGRIDTTRPYAVSLPSGRRIAVFFYDGPLARAVAFEGLLGSGERFAEHLLAGAPADGQDRLVHIATDGETYGHHHRHGEMALSYALDRIAAGGEATLTSYGEYLAAHPPAEEVEIVESSSWSCAHGIDRWREDCGCALGGNPGWTQSWRAPLRQALDELRDELAPLYEQAASEVFASPWAARDDYIAVVLDRSPASVDGFLARQARGRVPCGDRRVRALALLEMQRHAMLMYTSCGWFFDDLAGIEAVQVLRYAGRAAQLADELFGGKHERALLRRLARARSNDPRAGSGRDLYEAQVKPARVGPRQVAAHYAVRSLFADDPERTRIYGHEVERRHGFRRQSGRARLAVGQLRVTSLAIGAAEDLCYGALYFGDPHLTAGVRRLAPDAGDAAGAPGAGDAGAAPAAGDAAAAPGDGNAPASPEMPAAVAGAAAIELYERAAAALDEAFASGNLAQVVRLLDRQFAHATYTLQSLFRDEQRAVLDRILAETVSDVEDQLREIFRRQAPLMRFLGGMGTPLPAAFRAIADFMVAADLGRALEDLDADPQELERRLQEASQLGVTLDAGGLACALEQALTALVLRLREHPDEPSLLARAAGRAALARSAPFPVDLWRAQNLCHELRETVYLPRREAAGAGDQAASAWTDLFRQLAERLSIRVE
jgi:alpha-amylase/alpha-mannosidase (GH57 family)